MKPLTLKNILNDSILILAAGVIQFYGYVILALANSSFFMCGNDYLNTWKDSRNYFLICTVILTIQALLARKLHKTRTIVFRIAVWTIVTSMILVTSLFGIDTLMYSNYYKEFDAEKWKLAEEKPLSMVRVFYEDQRFIGKSRQEIIETLGEGYESWTIDSNEIGYRTTGYASPLVLTLENDTVVSYELECHD